MLGWLVGAVVRHLVLIGALAGLGAGALALSARLEPARVRDHAVVQGGLRFKNKPMAHPLEVKERLGDAILDAPEHTEDVRFRVRIRRAEKTNLPTQVFEVDVYAATGEQARGILDFALDRMLARDGPLHAAQVAISEHQIADLDAEDRRLEASLQLPGANVDGLEARRAENSRYRFGTGEVLSRLRTSPTTVLERWSEPRPEPSRALIRTVGGGLAGLLLGLLVAFLRGPAGGARPPEDGPPEDGVLGELSAFVARYHRLVLSVAVVSVAAALAQATKVPPRSVARLVLRPAAVATRPVMEIRAVQSRVRGVIEARRERGGIPYDVDLRTQVIRQQPPYDIDVSLLALVAEGAPDAPLASVLEGLADEVARTQREAFAIRRDYLQTSLQTQTATLARVATASPDPARHEAAQNLIIDLHRRQRDLSPLVTHPAETVYGPHTFTVSRPPYARYGAFGLAGGLVLGTLVAAFLAGFRAHYRGRGAR